MTKAELQSLVGKGRVNVSGIDIEVTMTRCLDSDDFIKIKGYAINDYTTDLELGDKWMEYVTDEECAELVQALAKYRDKMLKQAEIYHKDPIKLCWFDTEYRKGLLKSEKGFVYEIVKPAEDHFEIWSTWGLGYESDVPMNISVEIDGIIYRPIWSWWLDHGCYRGQAPVRVG